MVGNGSESGAASGSAEIGAAVQPPKEQKQWGPVANRSNGRGGGQNSGKWTGVDPVVFITDETILSSLIQFYGMGGPSEAVVRSQLVRSG